MSTTRSHTIAVLGGTGPQGRGLAYRLALAGHGIRLGSRSPERANRAVESLRARLPDDAMLDGFGNVAAVEGAELSLLTVPFDGQLALLGELVQALRGELLVSCVNPIAFDADGPSARPVPEGSAAEQAAIALPDTTVVAAFHHLSATNLLDDQPLRDETVLVCGDDADAKRLVVDDVAPGVAARGGLDAGPLRNAQQLEAMTAVLIHVNRTYGVHSGLSVSGVLPPAPPGASD